MDSTPALILTLSILGGATSALSNSASVDAIEPAETCERFLAKKDKAACLKTVKNGSADSYLAAICQKQDSDEQFMLCLKMADNFNFDPKKIQACSDSEMADTARLDCLKKIADVAKPTSNRLPASSKKKPK